MRLFCRENHDVEEIEEPRNYKQELLEAKARLAKLKKLPLSSFPESKEMKHRFMNGQLITFTVDIKDDAIAKAEAKIAELEVLTEELKDK